MKLIRTRHRRKLKGYRSQKRYRGGFIHSDFSKHFFKGFTTKTPVDLNNEEIQRTTQTPNTKSRWYHRLAQTVRNFFSRKRTPVSVQHPITQADIDYSETLEKLSDNYHTKKPIKMLKKEKLSVTFGLYLVQLLDKTSNEKIRLICEITDQNGELFDYYMSSSLKDEYDIKPQNQRMGMLHDLGLDLKGKLFELSEIDLIYICSDLYLLMFTFNSAEEVQLVMQKFHKQKLIVDFSLEDKIIRYCDTISGPGPLSKLKDSFNQFVKIIQGEECLISFMKLFPQEKYTCEHFIPINKTTQDFFRKKYKTDTDQSQEYYS